MINKTTEEYLKARISAFKFITFKRRTIKETENKLKSLEINDEYMGSPYLAATLLQRHNLDLTNVRIKDEETLLLGGMITQNEQSATGKVPILGDIPWIGALFRSQSKKMLKEELLFMITPRIIKDSEDVAEL